MHMKIVGLIAEYNPFHNGHAYHIRKAKAVTGADYCIVIMSGNYVQRGTPAVISKYDRTRMALESGADLVLELPVSFSTSSAELFAKAAVSLLDHTGIVDCLCFGSECGEIEPLQQIAHIFLEEPPLYREELLKNLREGNPYPKARNDALIQYLLKSDRTSSAVESIYKATSLLSSPNNILGIEYLKALISSKSRIVPYTISRMSSQYHSMNLDMPFCSATAIRTSLEDCTDLNLLRSQVPDGCLRILNEAYEKSCPITSNDFSSLLNYRLLTEETYSSYDGFSEELAARLQNLLPDFMEFENWADALKTKSYTRTRICRSLLHLILGIRSADVETYQEYDCCLYARILGFRSRSSQLLTHMKNHCQVPMITKMADAKAFLSPVGRRMLEQEIHASHLYNLAVFQKFGTKLKNEYRAGIIKWSE